MKFLHLSDLHIGLKLIGRDLREDQEYILDEIVRIAKTEKPDAVVIAGDIYDKAVPSAEAYTTFDRFATALHLAVPDAEIMMISGNHDSAPRVNVYRNILEANKVHMIGMPPARPEEFIEKVTLQDAHGPVNFYLLPFVKPSMVSAIVGTDDRGYQLSYDASVRRLLGREHVNETERNVLVSHQFYLPVGEDAGKVERMESEICTVGNIDEVRADVLGPFDYAALGHIHKPMKVGSDFYRYCGTPIACSVSEAGQQKGVILVEMKEKGCVETSVIPLHPLRQIRIVKGLLEDVLKEASGDYVRVVLTDKEDLDAADMQSRLRNAFPYLLEIRRENLKSVNYTRKYSDEKEMDPYELCCSFLGDVADEEKAIIEDVFHAIRGGERR